MRVRDRPCRLPPAPAATGRVPLPSSRRKVLLTGLSVSQGTFVGRGLAMAADDSRAPRAGCVFCEIVRGEGTRKIYEDQLCVAFHDIRPAAKLHLQVIPRVHIQDSGHLRNSEADKQLVRHMLAVGQKLVHRLEPDAETKFGFHDPLFLSVPHLHLHCFALPHKPFLAFKYIVSRRVQTGFVTVDELLRRMQRRPPADA